jgi:alpha-mannosidase
LRSAEALSTLVALQRPGFLDGRAAARDLAFLNLGLYWEHDWTADGHERKTARAAWQRRIAAELAAYVDGLQRDGAAALGGLIRKSGEHPRFWVLNPLGFARSGAADIPWEDAAPTHVVDVATDKAVPSQRVGAVLRIFAEDVPSVGYKVYELRPGAGPTFPDAATRDGQSLENDEVRVTLSGRGALTSLVAKRFGNRELIRGAANDLGGSGGEVVLENAGPVTVTLRAGGAGPPARRVRLTLTRGSARVDLVNEITENFSDVRAWGFRFALEAPELRHEEVGAVLRAKLSSQGGDYAPRQARYDWLTLNHFADLTGTGDVGITLANADCAFFKAGESTPERLDAGSPNLAVLAGGQVDGPKLGIRSQGGDAYFLQRFALLPHGPYRQLAAMKAALEQQNPFVVGAVTGGAESPYPPERFSLVELSTPDALLWALKPAEEGIGAGVIARLWNQSDAAAPATLVLRAPGWTTAEARRCTHLETDLEGITIEAGAVPVTLARQGLATVRLLRQR